MKNLVNTFIKSILTPCVDTPNPYLCSKKQIMAQKLYEKHKGIYGFIVDSIKNNFKNRMKNEKSTKTSR